MKKLKSSLAIVATLLFIGIFAMGCALFATDVDYSNRLVVASIRRPNEAGYIEITRRQLVDAYDSWGFNQFVSQQNMTQEQAYKRTLDILIDREILVDVSKRQYGLGGEHGITKALTLEEYNKAKQNVINSFDSQVRIHNREVRREEGVEDPDEKDVEEDNAVVFKPHQHYISTELLSNNIRIFERDISRFIEPNTDPAPPSFEDHLASAFQPRGGVNATQQERLIARRTRERMLRALRAREQGLADDWKDQDVFMSWFNRIQLEEEKNALVTRFGTMHAQGVMGGGLIQSSEEIDKTGEFINIPATARELFELFTNRHSSVRDKDGRLPLDVWKASIHASNENYINQMVDRARAQQQRQIRTAIELFNKDQTTESSIRQSIISGIGGVHWAPDSIIHEFFTVSHVLVGWGEEGAATIREIRAGHARGDYDDVERDRRIKDFQDNFKGKENLTAGEVLGIMQQAVHSAHPDNRPSVFRDLIYRFGTDPGMQNPDFEYVMGIDIRPVNPDTGLREGTDTNAPNFVPEFIKASRDLYNWDDRTGRPTGQVGDMSGLVWTDHGAHIIMYTRPVSTMVFHNASSMLVNSELDPFLFARQTSYGNKLFFDTIIDSLSRHEYARAEEAVLNRFKQDAGEGGIRVHTRRFSDLW